MAKIKIKKIILVVAVLILSIFTFIGNVSAQTKLDGPGLRSPSGSAYNSISNEKNMGDFLVGLTNFSLSFVTTIAVLMLLYGGFLWITDRGESDSVEKAKKIIAGSIIGILIIISAYTVINTISGFGYKGPQCDLSISIGGELNPNVECGNSGSQALNSGIGGYLGGLFGQGIDTLTGTTGGESIGGLLGTLAGGLLGNH